MLTCSRRPLSDSALGSTSQPQPLGPVRNAVHLWRKHGRRHGLALLAEIHPLMLPLKWLVYQVPDCFRRR